MNKKMLDSIAKKIINSESISIASVMVKFKEAAVIDINDSNEILKEKLISGKCLFYPVAQGSRENIIGIVKLNEILKSTLTDGKISLSEGLQEPVYFSETSNISEALSFFKQSKTGAALVINRDNNIVGFISIQDIVNYLLGNLPCYSE